MIIVNFWSHENLSFLGGFFVFLFIEKSAKYCLTFFLIIF